MDWLEIAIDAGFDDGAGLLSEADLEALHGRPPFRALKEEILERHGPAVRNSLRRREDAVFEEGPLRREEFDELTKQGIDLLAKKEYEAAVPIFKQTCYRAPCRATRATVAYKVACAYSLAEDRDRAIAWLETALDTGYSNFAHLKRDSDLDGLRTDPRYRKLLAGK